MLSYGFLRGLLAARALAAGVLFTAAFKKTARRGKRFIVGAVLLAAFLVLPHPAGADHFDTPLKAMWRPPQVGKGPNNFTLPDPASVEHRLSDYKGKVILLSFWSCYTDSCFTEVRVIKDYLEEFHERGLVAPTVCSAVPPALAEDQYAGLLDFCSRGQLILIDGDQAVTDKYRLHEESLPISYLIDRDFIVREIVAGAARLREPGFRRKIERLIGGTPEGDDTPR